MKQFHIISVGTSILRNAKEDKVISLPSAFNFKNDDQLCEYLLENPSEIQKLVSYIQQAPTEHSAELNAFYKVVRNIPQENVSVYLIWTNTKAGELCKIVLEKYLAMQNFSLFTGNEVSGYFWESLQFDDNYARDEFQRSISELVDRLIYLASIKQKEGYQVLFNATGGLKAHVVACSLAGFITNSQVYYINEDFTDVIIFPALLYLPKGRELDVLEKLSTVYVSEEELEHLINSYSTELERLSTYSLVDLEYNPNTSLPEKIRITNKGKFLFNQIKEKLK